MIDAQRALGRDPQAPSTSSSRRSSARRSSRPSSRRRSWPPSSWTQLEDIYLPYKQKRKTKARPRAKPGLSRWPTGSGIAATAPRQPQAGQTLELWAFTFRNDEKGINDAEAAIAGAQDILIERLSETQELRQLVRDAHLRARLRQDGQGREGQAQQQVRELFQLPRAGRSRCCKPQNSHRYLAIRRGWMEEELTLGVGGKPSEKGGDSGFEAELLKAFESAACTVPDSPGAAVLHKAARLALKAHVLPSIENEAHKALKEVADDGRDPRFRRERAQASAGLALRPESRARRGSRASARAASSRSSTTPASTSAAPSCICKTRRAERRTPRRMLAEAVKNGSIRAIAVGNGTAGRETESFRPPGCAQESSDESRRCRSCMVSEVGRQRLQRERSRARGVSGSRPHRARRDLDRAQASRPARRAREGRPQEHRRRPVPARRLRTGSQAQPRARRGFLREPGRRQPQHGLVPPALARRGHRAVACQGDRRASRDEGPLQVTRGAARGSALQRTRRSSRPRAFCACPRADNPLDNTGVHPERYGLLEGLRRTLWANPCATSWARACAELRQGPASFKTSSASSPSTTSSRSSRSRAATRATSSSRSSSATTSPSSRTCSPA